MKQSCVIFLSILLTILLVGCSANGGSPSKQESSNTKTISVASIEGLSCKAERDTYSTDATVINVLIENHTNASYSLDSNISILEKSENNQWISVPLNDSALNLGARISLKQGNSSQADFQTSLLLSNPQPGKYRAILPVTNDDTQEEHYLAAEFSLK